MTKTKRKKKKSYNPFKMVGSYLGILVLLVLVMSTNLTIYEFSPNPIVGFLDKIMPGQMCEIQEVYIWIGYGEEQGEYDSYFCGPYFLLFLIIYGFLIGWGIHSLFRRYSK